mmetsp:Transcript_30257/g.39911  ORF Transcript_30257/g.39911 Transcript_30257/m.39911 type:complete len:237 (-) Transcript_30257:235-945(-)
MPTIMDKGPACSRLLWIAFLVMNFLFQTAIITSFPCTNKLPRFNSFWNRSLQNTNQLIRQVHTNNMEGTRSSEDFKDLTLTFCRAVDPSTLRPKILLGLKKYGFGEGKWNGFGGKVEPGETVSEAAARELAEESGVTALRMEKKGRLIFHVDTYPAIMRVHVFEATEYTGEPRESEEMRPQWFYEDELPFQSMWADDAHWMPLLLSGKKFSGEFKFSDESTIEQFVLDEVEEAPVF